MERLEKHKGEMERKLWMIGGMEGEGREIGKHGEKDKEDCRDGEALM